jgi:hypothetical protein
VDLPVPAAAEIVPRIVVLDDDVGKIMPLQSCYTPRSGTPGPANTSPDICQPKPHCGGTTRDINPGSCLTSPTGASAGGLAFGGVEMQRCCV